MITSSIVKEKIIQIDALQLYEKYTDVFYMEDVPEVERDDTARHVADQILQLALKFTAI